MINQAALPIEKWGVSFRVPTLGDIARFQEWIDLPAKDREFVSISEVTRWCLTAKAIHAVLAHLAGVPVKDFIKRCEAGDLGRDVDRAALVSDLIGRFYGDGGQAAEEGDEADPQKAATISA